MGIVGNARDLNVFMIMNILVLFAHEPSMYISFSFSPTLYIPYLLGSWCLICIMEISNFTSKNNLIIILSIWICILSGLFLIFSLEREEAEDLIKRHGGRITSAVSKKTVMSYSLYI